MKYYRQLGYDSDDILLMKECAYRLMDKKPPKMRNFNYKKQLLRAILGYSGYLIALE